MNAPLKTLVVPVPHAVAARSAASRLASGHRSVDLPNGIPAEAGRWSDPPKAILDWVGGVLLFAALLPVMGIAWAFVRLTSAGPGVYTQSRVGRGGRQFKIYKLRTMYHNCEAATGGAKWSLKGDPRVTPLGRILRKLHVDELPQLWNVLRGEMSLVGPRPERPEFVAPLSAKIPGYLHRLAVRPGVTGLAQIQLPPDTDVESVSRKLALDACYIQARGLWLDFRIMFGTVVYLAGVSFAAVRRVLRLPNPLVSVRDDLPAEIEFRSSAIAPTSLREVVTANTAG